MLFDDATKSRAPDPTGSYYGAPQPRVLSAPATRGRSTRDARSERESSADEAGTWYRGIRTPRTSLRDVITAGTFYKVRRARVPGRAPS